MVMVMVMVMALHRTESRIQSVQHPRCVTEFPKRQIRDNDINGVRHCKRHHGIQNTKFDSSVKAHSFGVFISHHHRFFTYITSDGITS